MLTYFHNFEPQRIMVSIGPINIYWYSFFIIVGIVLAIAIAIKLGSYYDIKKEKIIDLSFWLVIFGIIGARLYDVLLELPYYLGHPIQIFEIWKGGLAIHGAILAGLITVYVFSKKNKIGFFKLCSIIVPGLSLSLAIGRWGNFFNQELFGLPTNVAWGIYISPINRAAEYIDVNFFHPTFLYESVGSFIIFILLILLHVLKIKGKNISFVFIVFIYLILYSILRFSLEFVRIDYAPEIFGLRWPQITSLFIILTILTVFFIYIIKNKRGIEKK